MTTRTARRGLGFLCALALGAGAHADVYPIDFFPELPQTDAIQQLLFVPTLVDPYLERSQVTGTRLRITFTTAPGFNAADLSLLLAAPITGTSQGFIAVTGADLGWSGSGTFSADMTSHDLDGTINAGRWQFDLMGAVGDPPTYSGSFSTDSRIEILYTRICPGDANRDGSVGVQDVFDYLAAFFEATPLADFNRDGQVGVQDLFDFLAAWFINCA